MTTILPLDADNARAVKLCAALAAYFHDEDDRVASGMSIRFTPSGPALRFYGHEFVGGTVSECLDKLQAWALGVAADTVKESRERLDRDTARQRALEEALS